MPTVEFLDWGKKVNCGQFANLRKIALLHGVPVYRNRWDDWTNCRGNGLCGKCAMEIVEGLENLSPRNRRERWRLKNRPANWRLSCQTQVLGDVCCITARALEWKQNATQYAQQTLATAQ
jgi:ferredoxin